MTIALTVLGSLALLVAIIAVYDLTQRKHAVTRNFPVIGHFRYFFEEVGQPLRQYFFAGDLDERPYNRITRSWVYASAKGQNNLVGFGSQVDHNQPGRMLLMPSMYPALTPANTSEAELPRPRIIGATRPQLYQPVGSTAEIDGLCREIRKRGGGPDFITVDGNEGAQAPLHWHWPTTSGCLWSTRS